MLTLYTTLRPQLACILFQLPPSFRSDHETLQRFLDLAAERLADDPSPPRLAVEFRNASWNTLKTLQLLSEHSCGMVLHDMSGFGGWHWKQARLEAGELSLSAAELLSRRLPLFYLRFHGTTAKYAGEYDRQFLSPWAELARLAIGKGLQVHAYFNNTQSGAAVRDALRFQELIQTQL
jgi:uncharacterized protein YecE (DUF72 family)